MARSKRRYIGMNQQPDGRWRKRFTVDGQRVTVYGKTPQEAEEKAIERRIKTVEGTYQKNNAITLNQYFKEWIKRKEGHVSGKTVYEYQSRYASSIEHTAIGRRRIQKIERRELLNFQMETAAEHTPRVANNAIMLIGAILKSALLDEIISKNPCVGIPRMKSHKKAARDTIHRALTPQELEAFMKAAKGGWYYNAFCLMLATGLRAGECGALEWANVDWKNNVLHIRRTVSRNRTGETIIGNDTKTKQSRRDIPMNAEIKRILEAQRTFYRNLHWDKVEDIHSRIFENTRGGIMTGGALDLTIRRLLEKHNAAAEQGKGIGGIMVIDHFSVHALRDTFATMAIIRGMQPNTLKEIMGHKYLSMTMDLYAHVLDEEKQKAMENLRIFTMNI